MSGTKQMNFYYDKVGIIRVIDGDTIVCKITVDIGFKVYAEMTQVVRLAGINAPEIRGVEKLDGLLSKGYLLTRVQKAQIVNSDFKLRTFKTDSFGRYVAELYIDNKNINKELVQEGFAKEDKRFKYGDNSTSA